MIKHRVVYKQNKQIINHSHPNVPSTHTNAKIKKNKNYRPLWNVFVTTARFGS